MDYVMCIFIGVYGKVDRGGESWTWQHKSSVDQGNACDSKVCIPEIPEDLRHLKHSNINTNIATTVTSGNGINFHQWNTIELLPEFRWWSTFHHLHSIRCSALQKAEYYTKPHKFSQKQFWKKSCIAPVSTAHRTTEA